MPGHFRCASGSALPPLLLLLFLCLCSRSQANSDANRLYEDLMMSYNRFVRPVQNDSDTLVVKLGLKLSQLIDVVSTVATERRASHDAHSN